MLRRIAIAGFGCALVAITGCTRTLALRLPADAPVELKTFVVSGVDAQPQSRLLQPASPEYQRLQDWLAQNQSGWSQSYAATPIQGVIVHSGGLTLHFVDETVYASTEAGQFQKQIQQHDYAFLRAALGI